jgi:hypothetical protein
MILYVFKVHTPIFPTPYIPLKIPPGEAMEGPFLISVRLNSGPAAVDPVDNWLLDQIPVVFNFSEVKNWLSLVISVVGWCILYVK